MVTQNDFKYARTINGIKQRIAFQLADAEPGDEYSGFDENWICARIYDTFKWLQGRRPNLFAHEVTFDLSPGDRHKIPEECDRLLEVLTITIDGKEHPVAETEYKNLDAARAYEKLIPSCALDYCIYTVAISEVDENRFLLHPPVSPNKAVTVTASCSDMNRFFVDPDKEIDCEVAKWINTVVSYVLAEAFSMDTDNPSNQALADAHRRNFFDLAPVQRREQPDN